MMFALFSIGVAAAFFAGSLSLLTYGRRLGSRYVQLEGAGKIAGLTTVEGAVFALTGLLVAFSVSGALQRFDERRQLILHEAAAIGTAYDRLALFEDSVARDLQARLKEYTGARLELYRMPHGFLLWQRVTGWSREQQDQVLERKAALWEAAVAACPDDNYRPACSINLLALGTVFEVARLRTGAAEKHPPNIVYVMLFGLGLGGSLLAGFSMGANKARSWIHIVIFAAALTLTLYVITDMEFPRLGLIRVDSFDRFLADVHAHMR